MTEESVNDNLFDKAKSAVGRLCFDISVDKKTCCRRMRLLLVEIEKMMSALGESGKE